jgi:hypothetical protein
MTRSTAGNRKGAPLRLFHLNPTIVLTFTDIFSRQGLQEKLMLVEAVQHATHMALALQRAQAQVTVAAILEVVTAVRSGQPLHH